MQHIITVNVSDCTEISSTENITVIRLPFSVNGFNILYEDYEDSTSVLCKIVDEDKFIYDGINKYTITYDINGNIIITINEDNKENE